MLGLFDKDGNAYAGRHFMVNLKAEFTASVVNTERFWNFVWKRRGLPPGPVPLPLPGNGITLGRSKCHYAPFQQWSREFGPIYTIWLACRGMLYGVVNTEGELWQETRRFALQSMHNLGIERWSLQPYKIAISPIAVFENVVFWSDLNLRRVVRAHKWTGKNADDNASDEKACDVPLAEVEPISLFPRLNTAQPMLADIFRFHLVGISFDGTAQEMQDCTLFKSGYLCDFQSETLGGLLIHQGMVHTRAERGTTHNCEYCNYGCFSEDDLGRHARNIHHRSISPLPNNGVLTERDWRMGYATGLQVDDPNKGATTTVRIMNHPGKPAGFFVCGTMARDSLEFYGIARSYAEQFVLSKFPENKFFDDSCLELRIYPNDLPRSGTSGSLAATAAIVSLALQIPTPFHIAMSGELHSDGTIRSVGGVIHKVIGARQGGKTTVLLPRDNEIDIKGGFFADAFDNMEIKFVAHFDEVYGILFS